MAEDIRGTINDLKSIRDNRQGGAVAPMNDLFLRSTSFVDYAWNVRWDLDMGKWDWVSIAAEAGAGTSFDLYDRLGKTATAVSALNSAWVRVCGAHPDEAARSSAVEATRVAAVAFVTALINCTVAVGMFDTEQKRRARPAAEDEPAAKRGRPQEDAVELVSDDERKHDGGDGGGDEDDYPTFASSAAAAGGNRGPEFGQRRAPLEAEEDPEDDPVDEAERERLQELAEFTDRDLESVRGRLLALCEYDPAPLGSALDEFFGRDSASAMQAAKKALGSLRTMYRRYSSRLLRYRLAINADDYSSFNRSLDAKMATQAKFAKVLAGYAKKLEAVDKTIAVEVAKVKIVNESFAAERKARPPAIQGVHPTSINVETRVRDLERLDADKSAGFAKILPDWAAGAAFNAAVDKLKASCLGLANLYNDQVDKAKLAFAAEPPAGATEKARMRMLLEKYKTVGDMLAGCKETLADFEDEKGTLLVRTGYAAADFPLAYEQVLPRSRRA